MARQGTYAKGTARREEILQATKQILADDGYRNLSLRFIARQLDLEPAHIIYYFGSREELLQAVIQRWDEDQTANDEDALAPQNALDTFVSTIKSNMAIPGIVHLYITFAAEAVHPDHAAHEYFQERFQAVHELLVDALTYEQSVGRVRKDINPNDEARKIIALADGLQLQALVKPDIDAAAILATAIDALREQPALLPAD